MKNLSNLSPAETLLILNGPDAKYPDLLKLTFLDLLLKQVFKTFEHVEERRNRIRVLKYIEVGQQYSMYQPLEHEKIFFSAFEKNLEYQILFRHMVKIGFQNAKNVQRYQKLVLKNKRLTGLITQNFFQSFFATLKLTTAGLELRRTLQTEIVILEKELPELLKIDPLATKQVISEIKGNIFLLKGIDLGMVKDLDAEIQTEYNRKYKEGSAGIYGGCGGVGCSWDMGCGGHHSGCSGGGCSGCGGCGGGGCGGCGS